MTTYTAPQLYEFYKGWLNISIATLREAKNRGESPEVLERWAQLARRAACLTDLWLSITRARQPKGEANG